MTFLDECPLCLLDKRIMGLQTLSGFFWGGGGGLGPGNQCPVATFVVLTAVLLKVKAF